MLMFLNIHKLLYPMSFIPFMLSMYLLINNNSNNIIISWEILSMHSVSLSINLIMDWMSLMYSFVVLFISANIFLFSKIYMNSDINKIRFSIILMLFILSMNLLIFIPNLATMLLGWDGLGMSSFILVIYYNNSNSLSAGMITALTNRLGDLFMLMTITISLHYSSWNPMMMFMEHNNLLLLMSMVIATMTKSAQMPFSSWLPAAMAAPTPVSALVHSSTLVTAGVYVLIRFSNMLNNFTILMFITIIGLLTSLMAGWMAMFEMDIKKIIALSTLSQLGIMFFALGMNYPTLAFFHMCTHAMFKATMFIIIGMLMLSSSHSQDMRLMSMSKKMSPTMSFSLMISIYALMGMPFSSGFYSKHMIMEWSINYSHMSTLIILTMLMLSLTFTMMYSSRLIMFCMVKPKNMMTMNNHLNHSISIIMYSMLPMSIFMGSMLLWIIPMPKNITWSSFSVNYIILTSILLSILLLQMNFIPTKWNSSMFFMNNLSSQSIIYPNMITSIYLTKLMDQTWLELFIPYSSSTSIKNMSSSLETMMFKLQQYSLIHSFFFSSMFMCFIYMM